MSLSDKQKGLVFGALAPLFYAIRSAILKAAPSNHLETFLFSRIFFDFLLLLPFFLRARTQISLKQVPLHLTRALFAVLAMFFSIYGMKRLYLADAILLESTLPLFIPILCFFWYREKMRKWVFFALVLGFFGVFLLLNPNFQLCCFAALAPLATACFSAITSLQLRPLSETESPLAILFYYYIFTGLLAGIPLFLTWEGFPDSSLWIYLVGISFFGVLFQFVNTRAYALLPPYLAGSFTYFSVLFGTLFGVGFFQESLSLLQVLGGSILCSSGIFILYTSRLYPSKRAPSPS